MITHSQPTVETKPVKTGYLSSVTFIRGIAALSVCLFHFSKGFVDEFSGADIIKPYAWLGVEVFFVISGFVISYGLLGKNFKLKHYPFYLLKRLARIEPAYVVSIFLILFLNYLSTLAPFYQGSPFSISFQNIVLHLGYLVEFFDGKWLNPVYWTLAVEFHFYLVIGFLIILWNKKKPSLTVITFVGFVALSFWYQEEVRFLKQTDIFAIGILTAFYKKKMIKLVYFLPLFIAMACIIQYNHYMVITILSVIAGLGMAFFDHIKGFRFILFVGNISYSLYLLHIPFGGRVINLFKRLELDNTMKLVAIISALSVSILAAWVFYIVIEKPSHRWSRSLKLKQS